MEKMKLKHRIDINGKHFAEIPYNFDELTADDIIRADKEKTAKTISTTTVMEFDTTFHLYLFAAAAAKANGEIAATDILRLKGIDAAKAIRLGRTFINGTDGGDGSSAAPSTNSPHTADSLPGNSGK